MTTTTTAGSDDTTMDDASSTSVERQDKHPSSNPKEITLKFVFKLKKTENIDVATLHRNLLMNIQRIDQNAKFFDQQGNGFNPLKANDFSSKYTYEKFPRQHFLLVCVAHKLCLNHSLNNLKRDMRNALVTNRASITIHTWSTLDTRDVGWLLHTHPRFHNRKDIHTKLSKTLTKINTDKQIPEFRLYVKTIVDNKQDNQRVSAQVITIECESCNVHRLRELLHTAYSSISQSLPGKFIPTNYQHIESKEKYSSLIRLQSQYLQDHRNISISGVTLDDLDTKLHTTTPQTPSIIIFTPSNKSPGSLLSPLPPPPLVHGISRPHPLSIYRHANFSAPQSSKTSLILPAQFRTSISQPLPIHNSLPQRNPILLHSINTFLPILPIHILRPQLLQPVTQPPLQPHLLLNLPVDLMMYSLKI